MQRGLAWLMGTRVPQFWYFWSYRVQYSEKARSGDSFRSQTYLYNHRFEQVVIDEFPEYCALHFRKAIEATFWKSKCMSKLRNSNGNMWAPRSLSLNSSTCSIADLLDIHGSGLGATKPTPQHFKHVSRFSSISGLPKHVPLQSGIL